MKKLLSLIIFSAVFQVAQAQEPMEKVMEARAKEMQRVIGLSDPDQWRRFIKENYTQALIDKPMRAKVQTSDDQSASSTTESTGAKGLDDKVKMYQRLHNDFGASKILSIKSTAESLTMVVEGESGFKGTFHLTFDKNKPYLIAGLGIEVKN